MVYHVIIFPLSVDYPYFNTGMKLLHTVLNDSDSFWQKCLSTEYAIENMT